MKLEIRYESSADSQNQEPYTWLKHLSTIVSAIAAVVAPIVITWLKLKT